MSFASLVVLNWGSEDLILLHYLVWGFRQGISVLLN